MQPRRRRLPPAPMQTPAPGDGRRCVRRRSEAGDWPNCAAVFGRWRIASPSTCSDWERTTRHHRGRHRPSRRKPVPRVRRRVVAVTIRMMPGWSRIRPRSRTRCSSRISMSRGHEHEEHNRGTHARSRLPRGHHRHSQRRPPTLPHPVTGTKKMSQRTRRKRGLPAFMSGSRRGRIPLMERWRRTVLRLK